MSDRAFIVATTFEVCAVLAVRLTFCVETHNAGATCLPSARSTLQVATLVWPADLTREEDVAELPVMRLFRRSCARVVELGGVDPGSDTALLRSGEWKVRRVADV